MSPAPTQCMSIWALHVNEICATCSMSDHIGTRAIIILIPMITNNTKLLSGKSN